MRVAIVVLLPLVAAHVSAQSMDIVDQTLNIDVVDGFRVEIDARVRTPMATSLLWLPTFLADVEAVEVDGAPAELAPHPDYPTQVVEVTLPEPTRAEQEIELRIVLDGTPRCALGAPVGATWCWSNASETILPGAGSAAWYLSNLLEPDAFIGRVSVRAPASFVVYAGQGGASEVVEEGAARTWTFDLATPTQLMGLYAGEADVATHEGFDVVHHADRDDATKVARIAELGSQLWPLYADLFGVRPTDSARIVLVPRNFAAGGLGVMGSPFLGEYVVGELDYLLEQGAAHELAHSWFGGVASAGIAAEGAFMQEAFAEWAAWLALGELQGNAARVSGNRMNATYYMYRRPDDADVPILAPAAQEHPAYVHAAYHKGSQVLRMLEARVGHELFLDAIRGFVARGTGGLTVAALVEEIERASGENVDDALRPWLRETGFPVLHASADAIELEGAWDLRIPVRRTFSDGRTTDEVIALGSIAESDAVLVEIDPDWTMAREVRSERAGDVTLDGRVDAADLIAIALRAGTELPETRRVDGGYDPLFDLNEDRRIDLADLDAAR